MEEGRLERMGGMSEVSYCCCIYPEHKLGSVTTPLGHDLAEPLSLSVCHHRHHPATTTTIIIIIDVVVAPPRPAGWMAITHIAVFFFPVTVSLIARLR